MPEGRRSEDWVNSISRTLQWNSRQRQKAMKEYEKKHSDEPEENNKANGVDGKMAEHEQSPRLA